MCADTKPEMSAQMKAMLDTHPCYNVGAHTKFARMHLPVAPRCNVQCNYCNRKYDCANESRPGVTSEVLTPAEAVEKIRIVKEKIPQLSVIGIAGPGDPLANEETFLTLELVRKAFPELTLCLSTNGLMLPASIERLKALGVKFITVTINAIDPEIAAKIYDFVVYEGRTLRGAEAGKRMIENQLKGIEMASRSGMLVKANVVMVPEVNADHIPEVAKKVKEAGAYIVNIIPLIPVPGANFENKRAPTAEERKKLQDLCEPDILQMRHCRFCRADAIGLLGEDRSAEFAHVTCGMKKVPTEGPVTVEMEGKVRHKVAVASEDGATVDTHFGHAKRFLAFAVEEGQMISLPPIIIGEMPNVAMFGEAHRGKLEMMAAALKGFDVVVAKSFGDPAKEFLEEDGIMAMQSSGKIEDSVKCASDAVYKKRARVFE
ncbi:MAG: molybdenum cofactor biosynthesis protein A [Methanomassiliicoccales archaeon PtaU1.Bin124]|nr:MAG: molybdenum cofactor biosynthesis protein A [Methanomassiliicoccales archaeon PtaU1.Bin124]